MAGHGNQESGVADSIKIIPYVKQDGIPSFRDSEIVYLWEKAVQENLDNFILFDIVEKNKTSFLYYMKHVNIQLFIIFFKEKLAGFVWLSDTFSKKANIHGILFKEFWGEKAIMIGRFVLNSIINLKFKDEFLYDVLVGIIPTENLSACSFVPKIGMLYSGEIPFFLFSAKQKKQVPAHFFYYARG